GTPTDVLTLLIDLGLCPVGAVARGGTPYTEIDWTVPSAIVLGNESGGLDPEAASLLEETVTIPMAGRAESLNVSMAASVLCFEILRQRALAAL
ncbi:MAG TPA: TrmH family RNA methyltransferase, partial [Acidimicrobiales bacterium]|nr:TrmH family RNA methyltransferase [Acidimicrobiales bacterium]